MQSIIVPEQLKSIPEVQEINALIALGLGPRDIIEAVLSPLTKENRTLLQSYLNQIENHSPLMTELITFDDMELVYITEITPKLFQRARALGMCGSS